MNRNYRGEQMGSLRASMMKEKDEELALFLEMRKREKEKQHLLMLNSSDEFDASLGPRIGTSPIFNLETTTNARKTATDDFLNSENDKNDYEWLLTPPGTPLFPSLEMESHKTVMSQLEEPKARPVAMTSRLANLPQEPSARNNISRRPASSSGLNTSTAGLRRPSSSGGPGSRPATPTGRPSLTTASRTTSISTTKSAPINSSRTISTATSRAPLTASVRSSRSSTPTRSTTSSMPTVPARSSTPTSRSSARSSTPTSRPSAPTPTSRSSARSSTPTSRPSDPTPKSTSRAATPTRRSATASSVKNGPSPSVKPMSPSSETISSSAVTRTVFSQAKNPVPPRTSSPSVKPRPWKPSEMPGFSHDAPPNLRTTLPDRPLSATRGRPGAASARSSSVEPVSNGKVRRQSCSPSRGRPPNGKVHSIGSSVPAMNRLYAKANDNVSPGMVGSKMVERVINMRKLPPSKHDEKHSPQSNLSMKSSSPDSSGFGRTLSKKSLDMAIRHMDIRRSIPGNLRPLMTNIPASSMYSVRSGPTRGRAVSVTDSPLGTSSNASSDMSTSNNGFSRVKGEIDDDVSSSRGPRSPASVRGR